MDVYYVDHPLGASLVWGLEQSAIDWAEAVDAPADAVKKRERKPADVVQLCGWWVNKAGDRVVEASWLDMKNAIEARRAGESLFWEFEDEELRCEPNC